MKVTVIVLLVLLCGACGSKSESEPKPTAKLKPERDRKPERVDCDRMCKRTFDQCIGEVLIATGKVSAKKLAEIKEAGALSKVQQAGLQACAKDCRKKRGFGSDTAEINKCLGLEGCQKFADCIKKHIQ